MSSRIAGKYFRLILTGCILSCFALPQLSHAGGFQILENSAEGMGVGFAGSAAGYGDGSEVHLNPAAMAWLEGTVASHSSHLIISSAEFSNQGSSNPTLGIPLGGDNGPDGGDESYVPNVYLVHQMSDELHVGLGINAPFGLATEYDRDWVGRYEAVKSELTMININPAVSYNFDQNFSLGAGLNIMYADAELSNMVDTGTIGVATLGAPTAAALGLLPQSADTYAKVDGDDWAAGFNLGLAFKYDERSRVGISWHSKVDLHISGDATFEVPTAAQVLTTSGFLTDTGARSDVTLPEYVNVGWIHYLTEDFAVLSELQWTHWSRFNELRVQFDNPAQPDSVTDEGWDNSWRYSIGGLYHMSDDLSFKAGFTFDEEPISDAQHRTPRIPGNDRKWLALGLDYQLTEDLRASASYAHLFISDANTNVSDSVGNNLVGEWDLAVDLVSLGLVWDMG